MIPQNLIPDQFHELLRSELSEKELTEIDIRLMGQLVYDRTLVLSRKVNTELLEPISKWLDDPNWLERFEVYEDRTPHWATYKKKQREWAVREKRLFMERMKVYWQTIRRKQDFRNEVRQIISRAGQRANPIGKPQELTEDSIIAIIAPFSPLEQNKRETQRQFHQALSRSISDLLPWKLLITSELTGNKTLKDLKTYCPENKKKDIASKLIHLLQMETEGKITLKQDEPFGNITIEPQETNPSQDGPIAFTDQCGRSYEFDWFDLGENQRNKVIADIKVNRIIWREAVSK